MGRCDGHQGTRGRHAHDARTTCARRADDMRTTCGRHADDMRTTRGRPAAENTYGTYYAAALGMKPKMTMGAVA